MNTTKEKQSKNQIIISTLVLTVILFAEMYFMINFKESYLPMIGLAVAALADVYIMIRAVMTLSEIKEVKKEEHFESLYKSQKASYIMLKKSFDEMREKLNELQEVSKVPAEEIINAQKGIAKAIINRNKENMDEITSSNNEILKKIDEVQISKCEDSSKEQNLEQSEMKTQIDTKFEELMAQLKDMEFRLNESIMSGERVVISKSMKELSVMDEVMDIQEDEVFANQAPEEDTGISVGLDSEEIMQKEAASEPELLVELEPIEEEKPAMPDMSDPNKKMNPDDIAALFANLAPAEEVAVEPEPIVEEKPAVPDMSDPNKKMSPDDIAALFANLAPAEEVAVEPEPIVEEKPAMPDMSDPNKVMSPEEIAALIANL